MATKKNKSHSKMYLNINHIINRYGNYRKCGDLLLYIGPNVRKETDE